MVGAPTPAPEARRIKGLTLVQGQLRASRRFKFSILDLSEDLPLDFFSTCSQLIPPFSFLRNPPLYYCHFCETG